MNTHTIFSSSNEYDIPDLLLRNISETPPGLDAPFAIWGSVARKNRFDGTYAFYTDDSKFKGLMNDPDAPILTGVAGLVEANYSIGPDTPSAVAIYNIYKKRWLSRYWQQERPGLNLWVDIAVSDAHRDKSLIGVPKGWQRYSTEAREVDINELDLDLDQVIKHSNGNPFSLIVYGGGREVAEWCRDKENIIHLKRYRTDIYRPGQGTRRRLMREAQERGE